MNQTEINKKLDELENKVINLKKQRDEINIELASVKRRIKKLKDNDKRQLKLFNQ